MKKLNKLVRDKIPQIIEKEGKIAIIKIASEKEYKEKLKEKLIEEAKEFLKSNSKEEFADIIEVLNAIGKLNRFNREEIEQIRKAKSEEKGSFEERIILEKII
jgi:predicted house-cleaning noncanonical NTP pyrophosphatase (MazG superfamily)